VEEDQEAYSMLCHCHRKDEKSIPELESFTMRGIFSCAMAGLVAFRHRYMSVQVLGAKYTNRIGKEVRFLKHKQKTKIHFIKSSRNLTAGFIKITAN
jgi:hypothetical protein